LLALAHHDGSVYRDTYELVLRRESGHPNDLWQADHTELDVMVLDAWVPAVVATPDPFRELQCGYRRTVGGQVPVRR